MLIGAWILSEAAISKKYKKSGINHASANEDKIFFVISDKWTLYLFLCLSETKYTPQTIFRIQNFS